MLLQVRATRLLLEKGRAVGVEYVGPEGRKTIRAEREVLVCCGAFETPKLLMLSGVGPSGQLGAHEIPVIRDLPGVGGNLQDHLLLGIGFESLTDLPAPEMAAEAGLFLRTRPGGDRASPDLQYFFGPVLQPSLRSFAPEGLSDSRAFTFTPILSQPSSRGTVTLASRDPSALARVDPRYLTRDEDLAVLEYGIRYARELAHTRAFDALRGREIAPGAAVTSRRELHAYIRRYANTVWHPVGTCKMGSDPEAVVDDQLRVHGVEGLRVVDASVMPTVVNGNPNAAVMMIAERAADLLRGGAGRS
ncbi:hypothetical protein EON77_18925 [bacterium]|nr:MAG: hypothetical protein EON77_18925 [bacterium]